MSEALRSSLWNVLDICIWNKPEFMNDGYRQAGIEHFSRALWFSHFKRPIDSRPSYNHEILASIRKHFFSCKWFEVYDILEWILNAHEGSELAKLVNVVLERELAAYRFVDQKFTGITDELEVAMMEAALLDDDFPNVKLHLRAALGLLSDRVAPDYRNSIKESICAVEAMARIVAEKPKATLGEALAVLEKQTKLHPALKSGFSSLYGYTSDESGIRHAMTEAPSIEVDEAKFFLLSCTSFINYLKTKLAPA